MLFLIGNPRSGTSLFRLLMTTHSEIHIPPECGFIVWWADKYGDWNGSSTISMLDDFMNDLVSSRKFEFWGIEHDALKAFINSRAPANYPTLCQLVYLFHANSVGKNPVYLGDKNNFHVHHVAELAGLYPDAKFVHIVRDGRDVATSYQLMNKVVSNSIYKPNLSTDIVQIAKEWCYNLGAVKKAFENLPANRYFEFKYEDLVTDTSKCLISICDFLQLEYQSEMLEYSKDSSIASSEPVEFLPWKSRTTQEIDSSSVGKFLHDWPEENVGLFEDVARDMLTAYGYPIYLAEEKSC